MIWPGPGVLPGGSNSSPVAMMATSGRRTTGSVVWLAEAASDSAAASSTRCRSSSVSPSSKSSPARRMWRPAATVSTHLDRRCVDAARILLDEDRVGAVRHRRAGEDAHRLAFADRAVERRAGRRFADHRKLRADGEIAGAHRIAVHRRSREGRLRAQRLHRLGQHAVGGIGERNRLGADRLGVVEQPAQALPRPAQQRRRHQRSDAR